MLLGAGGLRSPDLATWVCSVCGKPNEVHNNALCTHPSVYYISLKVDKVACEDKTYTNHCHVQSQTSIIHGMMTPASSTEKGIHLTETYFLAEPAVVQLMVLLLI